MKNKYFWTSILLAILLGIACGCLHAYSVAQHRTDAQIDTFNEIVTNTPTETVKAEYKQITRSQPVFAKEEVDVIRVYDDGVPNEIREAAEKYGKQYNICPEFLEALAYQESRFKADVTSADGSCIGLCQINQNCHKSRMKRLGVTDLTDIDGNMYVAADYLSEIFAEHEDAAEALYVYNGNSAGLKEHLRTGEIKSAYVREILERSEEYERLHCKK